MSVREGNVKYDVFTSCILEHVASKYNYVLPLTHRNMHAFSTAEIYAGERVASFLKTKQKRQQ